MTQKVNVRLGWIKVVATMDSIGNVLAHPLSEKYAVKFAKFVSEFTGSYDESLFFQEGGQAQEFVQEKVPKRYHGDLTAGFPVTFLADPWVVGHWYGYDAHTLVETGQLFKGVV